jgi:hypothetical protein
MSLDNIQLPPIVLQQLFKDSLIGLKINQPDLPMHKALPTSLNILGKNKKKIILIVSNDEAVYLPDEELNFLLGILSACKLTMEDVGILNSNKNKGVDYSKIAAELQAEKVFLFGIAPAAIGLPLGFPHYQVQQFNNQVYLTAPALGVLKDDKAEKGKLWNSLKNIFSI